LRVVSGETLERLRHDHRSASMDRVHRDFPHRTICLAESGPNRSPSFNQQSKGAFMFLKQSSRNRRNQLMAAAGLALVSSVAFADDSSMSVLTGDSYAYFNQLDYRAGKFNVARAPLSSERDGVRQPETAVARTQKPSPSGNRPSLGMRTSPFRNDTGA
jgi:hypothetical protein